MFRYPMPWKEDDGMNECVLVVDDDREIVNAISILLEKEGYRTLRAFNGLDALELASEQSVQLILLDVMMPKLDGLSALMKIRERRNLPVIVLSAKSEASDKILGLSMGADDYIAKPYDPQELLARVKSQLRRYTQLGGAGAAGSALLARLRAEVHRPLRHDSRDRVFVDDLLASLTGHHHHEGVVSHDLPPDLVAVHEEQGHIGPAGPGTEEEKLLEVVGLFHSALLFCLGACGTGPGWHYDIPCFPNFPVRSVE